MLSLVSWYLSSKRRCLQVPMLLQLRYTESKGSATCHHIGGQNLPAVGLRCPHGNSANSFSYKIRTVEFVQLYQLWRGQSNPGGVREWEVKGGSGRSLGNKYGEEPDDSFCSTNVRAIKWKLKSWVRHVARVVVGKLEGKRLLCSPRLIWEHNIKIDKVIELEVLDWTKWLRIGTSGGLL
jgi:hypothetical protein